ncbi:hypothetical protein [Mycolicibacterium peregrinum]|uniref:hypothetical protein n=1 Tax=Mycolicibacterium peregrinum TaxID=43304 RepID=UPI001F25D7AF|nr:hypothetical protein [Mycolicibacterium peregrinum]
MVLAIALAVVVTVLVVKPDGGGNGPSNAGANGSKSEFASADDTGPVSIITEDPTCAAWMRISQDYADRTNAVNWGARDSSIPATAWTPEQRTMYETVGKATSEAADRTKSLVQQTPHRVMRELFEQFVAYAGAFTDVIPTYTAEQHNLSLTLNSVGLVLANVCASIEHGSAQLAAPSVPLPDPPTSVSPPAEPTVQGRFMMSPNSICPEWDSAVLKFDADTTEWQKIDPNIPAAKWDAGQRATNDAVIPIILENADKIEQLGRQSKNSILEDIAVLSAQYHRAFANALPNYRTADNLLEAVASYGVKSIRWACKAAS